MNRLLEEAIMHLDRHHKPNPMIPSHQLWDCFLSLADPAVMFQLNKRYQKVKYDCENSILYVYPNQTARSQKPIKTDGSKNKHIRG